MNSQNKSGSRGFVSVLPILVFVLVFLGAGIACNAMGMEKPFAQFPASIGGYIALMSAFLIIRGKFSDKFNWMLKGIAKPSIAVPLVVFALAGAFATVAKACGGVDSIVGLCMNYVPTSVITAGFFVVGCIVSFASGSSISTIVALAPIALSIAVGAGISVPIMAASVMGSAMFGNSMSLISDCTIVSNSVMGIGAGKATKDKLISQALLYAIPFIAAIALYVIFGRPTGEVSMEHYDVNVWSILPYIFILVLALAGVNFVLSLSSGIVLGVIIGLAEGKFNLLEGCVTVAEGMYGMANMMLLFIFMAGTIGIVTEAGGIEWVINRLTKLIKGPKSAQGVIFLLGVLVTCCVGNDTIPMVTIGDVTRDISKKYRIDPRRIASIMPISTAGTAVIIPYTGAALTMASMIETAGAGISFVQTIPFNFFVLITFVLTFVTVFAPFSDRRFAKDPWDFEKWLPSSEAGKS